MAASFVEYMVQQLAIPARLRDRVWTHFSQPIPFPFLLLSSPVCVTIILVSLNLNNLASKLQIFWSK